MNPSCIDLWPKGKHLQGSWLASLRSFKGKHWLANWIPLRASGLLSSTTVITAGTIQVPVMTQAWPWELILVYIQILFLWKSISLRHCDYGSQTWGPRVKMTCQLVKPQLLAPSSRAVHPVSLGGAWKHVFLTSFQVIPMMVVPGPHSGNHCTELRPCPEKAACRDQSSLQYKVF